MLGFHAMKFYLQSKTKSYFIDFFKDMRWSKKNEKFVTPITEEIYVSVYKFGKKCSHLIPFDVNTKSFCKFAYRT